MLLFSCKLALQPYVTSRLFFEEMILWAQSGPFDENQMHELQWDGRLPARFEDGCLSMEFDGIESESLYVMRFEKKKDDILWRTDVCADLSRREIQIQLDRSFYEATSSAYAYFSTPRLISVLIEDGLIAQSDALPCRCHAHSFEGPWKDLYASLLDDERGFSIPLVVLGTNPEEPRFIGADALAWQIKGAAHVLVIEDDLPDRRLPCRCADYEKIADHLLHSSLQSIEAIPALPEECEEPIQSVLIVYPGRNREAEIVYVCRERISDVMEQIKSKVIACALSQTNASLPRFAMLKARKTKGMIKGAQAQLEQTENEYLALLEAVDSLESQICELRTENACYRQRLSLRDQQDGLLLHRSGTEVDFYPEEARDFVLEAIESALRSTKEDGRKADVFRDLLACNAVNGSGKRLEQRLRALHTAHLSPSRKVTELEHAGFIVELKNGHYKACFHGDPRYLFVFSSTPGDRRADANNLSCILQTLFH